MRRLVRILATAGILFFAWYAASAIGNKDPWAPVYVAIAAALLLVLFRASVVAERRR